MPAMRRDPCDSCHRTRLLTLNAFGWRCEDCLDRLPPAWDAELAVGALAVLGGVVALLNLLGRLFP